ncbi:MAG: hypothetical protein GYA14_12285 [Ignavibacteria bacterium]|nr:hypothetical protein [Ignavibacteria bacterium]
MKEDPKKNNKPHSKKVSINASIALITNESNDLTPISEEKQMLDLLMTPMSPNQVEAHYKNVFKQQRKAHKVRQILLKNKRRIKLLNHKFDLIAVHSLTLLEIDETFKGWNTSLLIVVDTFTGYLFYIHWIKERSVKGLLQVLNPIRELFYNVALVLTDGATYFPEVIAELCPKAKHQICLIHVLRNLYPILRPYQKRYKNALKKVTHQNEAITHEKEIHQEKARILKNRQQKLRYHLKKRDLIRKQLGVHPHQHKVLEQHPELKVINLKINEIQSYLRSDINSVDLHAWKIKVLYSDLRGIEAEKDHIWSEYMSQIKLLYQFYNLFHLTNAKYEKKRQLLLAKLIQYPDWELAQKIYKNLTTIPQLDTVNKQAAPIRLSRNFINTNVIESLNSIIRPYLDHLRNIKDTEYSETYFNLLRFKLNTTRPRTGERRNSSPIERYGYEMRNKCWLDILLDGLPRGPQYQLNSAKLNFERACPQRLNRCKIGTNT